MIISITYCTGLSDNYDVDSNNTVYDLKKKIQMKTGYSTDQFQLIFNKKYINDEYLLSYYNIQNNSTLYMVFRLHGGGANFSDLKKMDTYNLISNGPDYLKVGKIIFKTIESKIYLSKRNEFCLLL